DRTLADEERLALRDGPGHVGLVRVGEAIRVLADDDVALLEAQHALGLDAEGPDAQRLSSFHEGVPHMLAEVRGHVDLVAELADEADAQQAAGYAGNRRHPDSEIGEGRR